MKNFIALVLILGAVSVRAEEVTAIDAEHPLLNARVGISWDRTGKQHSTAYIPMISVVGKTSKLEYASLNMGVVDKMDDGKTGYTVSVGARIDNMFAKFGSSSFAQKYLLFAVLPPVQISPCFVTQDFKKFVPMLTIATRFGR